MHRRTFNPLFWTLAHVGSRVRLTPTIARDLTSAVLPAPTTLAVPTRHGPVRTVVVRPPAREAGHSGGAPPIVMQLHGGGFLNRYPEQDLHIARYLAANLGAVVLLPDYGTAPEVRYPVAEEEMFDVARWIRDSAHAHGWDGTRLLLAGISAGAKLAINVCQQLHSAQEVRPLGVALTVPVTDMSRTDRTSSIPRPAISPFVQRLVSWAYFPDVERRRERLAAPRYDAALPEAMPPTLIQTGEYDSLAAEGEELARVLEAAGVETVHRRYAGADHGFYSAEPLENVRQMLLETVTFFSARLAVPRA